MPIYAYRCESCGFAKDVLQKVSDAPLTDCPECGKSSFRKQLTAAGFQLKGTGWYVTDFRNNGSTGASTPAAASSEPASCPSGACSSPSTCAPDTTA
ncbi:MAG TPA: FmdB family zinc ribbon protein [Noviherbaspirillum sp.]